MRSGYGPKTGTREEIYKGRQRHYQWCYRNSMVISWEEFLSISSEPKDKKTLYGPPEGAFWDVGYRNKYNYHRKYCIKNGYITWEEYEKILAKKPRKYGDPEDAQNDEKYNKHKSYCEKNGFCTWSEYMCAKQNRVVLKSDEWGEDPTFRRPISEIIARINAKARK
jgi:hypothetical protein